MLALLSFACKGKGGYNMQEKRGISLIVLVITIIVMIVLAGAIILSLNNSGIIGKANQAVKDMEETTVRELAQIAWGEAYADGIRTVEDLADGTKGFETRIKEALEKNKIDPDNYLLNITTKGVTAKQLDKAWIKEGFTVVRGDKVVEIGDIVNYDETVGGTKTGLTNVDWKVLGADEDGNLLIMSASAVKTSHRLGYDSTDTTTEAKLEESQNDWLNGAAELDAVCEPYGYGKGVVGKTRSVRIEDVDAVTGYDKTRFSKGTLHQYGNVTMYTYNKSVQPAYNGTNKLSGILGTAHDNGFYYYDGKQFKHITDLLTGTTGNVFATLKSDVYAYSAPDLTTINKETNTKAYEMIFGDDDTYYWLASPYVDTTVNRVAFGFLCVSSGFVTLNGLWYSTGSTYYGERGVRAVVTLSSDIQLTGSSAEGWSY